MSQLEHKAILFSPLFSNGGWLRIVSLWCVFLRVFLAPLLWSRPPPLKFCLDMQSKKAAQGTGPRHPARGKAGGPNGGLSRLKLFTRPTFAAQTELFLHFWLSLDFPCSFQLFPFDL